MKAYGADREVKTSKVIEVQTEKGIETREEYTGAYAWKSLTGEVEITFKSEDGKKIKLLKLGEGNYKLTISVKADEPIEEEAVQAQLKMEQAEA